jgi:hypothetical protein
MHGARTSFPKDKLGIVFLHHRNDWVTLRNLDSFREWNPGVPIATVTSNERIKGGYSILDDPELGPIWRAHIERDNGRLRARSSDLLLFYWYLNRREHCKRWLVVEWDAFCAMPAEEFLAPVADFSSAGSIVHHTQSSPEWYWFQEAPSLPENLRPFAMGISPTCYIVFADEVLDTIVKLVPWDHLGTGNSELRLGTLVNYAGYDVVEHPLAKGRICWKPLPKMSPIPCGMWHPIKYIAPPSEQAELTWKNWVIRQAAALPDIGRERRCWQKKVLPANLYPQ